MLLRGMRDLEDLSGPVVELQVSVMLRPSKDVAI